MIPHAELDLAATIAATIAANAAENVSGRAPCAAAAAKEGPDGHAEGVHPGVTCDRTGVCPIVGIRYHLVGHNYDLCEAEFAKLPDKEKALYQRIPPPAPPPVYNMTEGVHPGVECDRSGMCPIVGTRYHLRGHNFDLCQAEFDKLPHAEKALYKAIPPPGANGANGGNGCPWRPAGGAAAAAVSCASPRASSAT